MGPKDKLILWLSSGGAYYVIGILWLICGISFAIKARQTGRDEVNPNDGCYLMVSSLVFVLIGGAIGLVLFQPFFPWYIFTSLAGAIIAPIIVRRKFLSGKRKY
jgi:uncharacterized membrane protein HdeD (DUF308 family)